MWNHDDPPCLRLVLARIGRIRHRMLLCPALPAGRRFKPQQRPRFTSAKPRSRKSAAQSGGALPRGQLRNFPATAAAKSCAALLARPVVTRSNSLMLLHFPIVAEPRSRPCPPPASARESPGLAARRECGSGGNAQGSHRGERRRSTYSSGRATAAVEIEREHESNRPLHCARAVCAP